MHALPKQYSHILTIASLDEELIHLLKKDIAVVLAARLRTTTSPSLKRSIAAVTTSIEIA